MVKFSANVADLFDFDCLGSEDILVPVPLDMTNLATRSPSSSSPLLLCLEVTEGFRLVDEDEEYEEYCTIWSLSDDDDG